MRRYSGFIGLFFLSITLYPQEEALIKQTIVTFFKGLQTNDTTLIRSTLFSSSTLKSIFTGQQGETILSEENVADLFDAVIKAKAFKVKEELISFDIKVDGPMALVWSPYRFFIDEKFSHCGVNAFTCIKTESAWKIAAITDTRRKEPCN